VATRSISPLDVNSLRIEPCEPFQTRGWEASGNYVHVRMEARSGQSFIYISEGRESRTWPESTSATVPAPSGSWPRSSGPRNSAATGPGF
jgi:hypothetical protein